MPDRSIVVEQIKGKEGRRVLITTPPVCEDFLAGAECIWEGIASQSDRFWSTANFDKSLTLDCRRRGFPVVCQFLLAPKFLNIKCSHTEVVSNYA